MEATRLFSGWWVIETVFFNEMASQSTDVTLLSQVQSLGSLGRPPSRSQQQQLIIARRAQ